MPEPEQLGRETQMDQHGIQYISDEEGNPTGVIIPIELWHEIISEHETAYLLKSEAMKQRLLGLDHRVGHFRPRSILA